MPQRRTDETGERTEQPTSLRLKEARRRGQVARSSELTSAAVALGVLVALALLAPRLLDGMTTMTRTLLDGRSAAIDAEASDLGQRALRCIGGVLPPVGWVLAASVSVAALAGFVQVGPVAATDRIRPDFARVGFAGGLKRVFSGRTIVRAVKSLAKVAIVAGVGYWTIRGALPRLVTAGALDGWGLAAEAGTLVGTLALRVVLCLLAVGGADYLYQRWQHRRDLRMTRREWREDVREMEGDPQIRGRRRRVAEQLGERSVDREVAGASVVIFAPHGPAAALVYDGTMAAPRVVARGRDWSALRIRRAARAGGVPMAADARAARAIYRHCRAGQEIPEALYDTVARILATCRGGPTGDAGPSFAAGPRCPKASSRPRAGSTSPARPAVST